MIWDGMGSEVSLQLEDVVVFSYTTPSPVTTPTSYSFSMELYSGESEGANRVERTPLLRGSVTLIPPLGVCTSQ